VLQTLLAFSGNAQPQLAVTRRLVGRGHRVRVLAHRAARLRVEATGAEFVPFERAQPDLDLTTRDRDTLRDWEARTRVGAGIRILRGGLFAFVLDVSRDCGEALADWPADAVVFDWMLTGAAVAAEAAGVPAVALVHCPYPLPVPGAPPLFTGLSPMSGPLGAARDRTLGCIAGRLLAFGLPVLNEARCAQGLQPLGRFERQLLGVEAIFLLSAPELDFSSRARLPGNVHYVGPAFEPYDVDWPSPFPAADASPLVLISLSTSFMDQQRLAQRILDAIAGLPVNGLLTVGPALDRAALQLPVNVRAVDFVPHRSVLPAASLVVTHAGWQTINAALAEGVPLLCVPDGRDQPDNAARVVACGAGVRVRRSASIRALRRAIARALADPWLAEGARSAARAQGRSDGAMAVADRLELLPADAGRSA
jgi:UDP:flavonoid glycosyltransferase YjiC (YdhE family)